MVEQKHTRPVRHCREFLAAALLLVVMPSALASSYDYCARGNGPELQKTLRVKLELAGADPGAEAPRVAAALIRHLMWEGKAEQVIVEPFDEADCAAALGRVESIHVTLSAQDIDKLKAETAHGALPRDSAVVAALAATARTGVDVPGAAASTGDSFIAKGRTRGVSTKSPPSPEAAFFTVQVYYATDRADAGESAAGARDPGARYGPDRGKGLAFGAVQVSVPREHRAGQLESPSILKLEFSSDPKRHVMLQSVQPLSADAWRAAIGKRATGYGKPGVLLFVHGYNVTFAGAALRAGQLAYDLAFPGATVFYSWPSRGSVSEYNADQQTVEWAIPNLQTVLGEIARIAAGAPVYAIAHSMGNRVFTRAFERLLTEQPAHRRAFREVVLTAPDIDAEIFRTQIAPRIVGVGPRVTLYASENDTALSTSRRLSAGYRRLGEAGPGIFVLPGMDTVDASRVKTDMLGHSYFGDSDTVLSDLFRLIRERKMPDERGVLKKVESTAGRYWQFP